MPKRFNNLKAALKLLRPLNGQGDAPDLADTSALGFYQAVVAGKKAVEYGDRANDSKPKGESRYALTPFATPAADATKVKVTMSQRAEEKVSAAGLTTGDLNALNTTQVMTDAVQLYRFQPAKITVRVFTEGTTPTNSKLTGRRYKKTNSASYTYPFGWETGKNYATAKSALAAKVQGDNRTASFTPERYA